MAFRVLDGFFVPDKYIYLRNAFSTTIMLGQMLSQITSPPCSTNTPMKVSLRGGEASLNCSPLPPGKGINRPALSEVEGMGLEKM